MTVICVLAVFCKLIGLSCKLLQISTKIQNLRNSFLSRLIDARPFLGVGETGHQETFEADAGTLCCDELDGMGFCFFYCLVAQFDQRNDSGTLR